MLFYCPYYNLPDHTLNNPIPPSTEIYYHMKFIHYCGHHHHHILFLQRSQCGFPLLIYYFVYSHMVQILYHTNLCLQKSGRVVPSLHFSSRVHLANLIFITEKKHRTLLEFLPRNFGGITLRLYTNTEKNSQLSHFGLTSSSKSSSEKYNYS